MKKIYKLLSCLLALSMIISAVVIPVSAEANNILAPFKDANGDTYVDFNNNWRNQRGNNADTQTLYEDEYYITRTGDYSGTVNMQASGNVLVLIYKNIMDIELNKVLEFSAKIRTTEAVKPSVYVNFSNSNASTNLYKGGEKTGNWNHSSAVALTDDWQEIKATVKIINNDSATAADLVNKGIHVDIRATESYTGQIELADIKLTEYVESNDDDDDSQPVVAENLIGAITDISADTITAEPGISAGATEPAWVFSRLAKNDETVVSFADSVVSISGRPEGAAHVGLAYNNLGVKAGKKYTISGEFRMDSDPGEGNKAARYYFSQTNADTDLAVKPADEYGSTNLKLNQWVTVSAEFEVGTATDTAGRTENGLHLGIKVGQNLNSANYDYSFRNLVVKEVTDTPGGEEPVQPEIPETQDNLLESAGKDYSFENGISQLTIQNGVEATSTDADASHGTKSVLVKGFSNNANTVRFASFPVTAGKTYKFTVDAKLEQEGEVSARLVAGYLGSEGGGQSVGEYNTQLSASEWKTISHEFTVPEGKTVAHLGPQFDSSSYTGGVYVDNYVFVETVPTVRVSATTPENEATDVALDETISVTFNRAVDTLAKSNFAVSGGVSVTGVSTEDNKTYILTTSALANGTEYTVTVSNVTATDCNPLTSYNFKFKTIAAAGGNPDTPPVIPVATNIFEDLGKNYSFENGTSGVTVQTGVDVTYCDTEASDGAKSILVKNFEKEKNNARIISIPVTAGKTYKFSLDAKLAADSGQDVVKIRACAQYLGGGSASAEFADITAEWGTYEVEFTVPEGKTSAHFGPQFDTPFEAGVYLDNFVLKEVYPTVAIASSTPAIDSEEALIDGGITLNFNTAVYSFTKDNILVTGGVEIEKIETTDNQKFKITTKENFKYDTTYTVIITDVYGADHLPLERYEFSFKTHDASYIPPTADPDSIIPAIASIEVVNGAYVIKDADDNVTGWKLNDKATLTCSNGVVSVTNRNAQAISGIKYDAAPLKSGQKYVISAKFRMDTNPDSGNLTARFFITTPDASTNLAQTPTTADIGTTTLKLGEWVDVKTIVEVGTAEGEGRTEKGLNIAYKVGQNSNTASFNYSIKEFKVIPLPEFSVKLTSDNVSGDTATVNAEFSVPPAEFTADDVEAASVKSEKITVSKVNDFNYKITLKGLIPEYNYTVSVNSDMVDIYNRQCVGVEDASFMTKERESFDNIFTNDNSFENKTWQVSKCDHWEYTTEDSVHGSVSYKNSGCGCAGSQVYKTGIPVEPSTEYIITFWAKHKGTVQVRLRNESAGNAFLPETFLLVDGTGEWTKYSFSATTPENMKLLRFYIPSSNDVLYLDNFEIYKKPGEMTAIASLPYDGSDNAPLDGTATIYFSNEIDRSINFNEVEKYFEIDNGAAISRAEVGADNASVTIWFDGLLKAQKTYNLKVKNIMDFVAQYAPEEMITFSTEPAIRVDGGIQDVQSTEGEVQLVYANIENISDEIVEKPTLIYTVYDGDVLSAVAGTAKEADMLNPGNADMLRINDNNDASGSKQFNAYLLTGFGDISLLGTIPSEAALEAPVVVTDTENEKVTVSGKAQPGEKVSVMILKPADSAKNVANVAAYKNKTTEMPAKAFVNADYETTKTINYSESVLHFAVAVADENGDYSVAFNVDKTIETVYGVLTSGKGFDETDVPVFYMPTDAILAEAENAINSASTVAEMKAATDAYGASLGFDVAAEVYETDGDAIAQALLAVKPQGGYSDFTSGNNGSAIADFRNISDYYEVQREALAVIAEATNSGITQALNNYKNYLGFYESANKLNYQAKYNMYGEYAVNQEVINLRERNPFTSMDDFVTRFNAIVLQTIITSGGGGGGGSSSGGSSSAGFGGAALSTPGTKAPAPEVVPMFSDIANVQWAAEAIENLAIRGIIGGMGDGTFAPLSNVTREQFVKMLVVSFNIPTASGNAFSDVSDAQWYAPYVYGAYNAGIITGVSEKDFGVGAPISRQDIVTMIYRVMKTLDTMPDEVTDTYFNDEDQISDYAKEAVEICASAGLINGVSEGMFAPQELATRAQTAVILDRLFTTYLDVYFY